MTLHEPSVLSGLFAAVGIAGFVASVANLTHAVSPRSPSERPENKVRHFWVAFYFAGIMLMGAAYFLGWAPAPQPPAVWISLCGAGWSWTHAARLGRMYLRPPGDGHCGPELPLFRRWACFWLIFGVTAGTPFVAGCLQSNPNYTAEQKTLLLAEWTLKANFDTIDAFLLFDDNHRAWMRQTLPDAHAFAEMLRRPGADGVQAVVAAQRAAWRAHDGYLKNPTADGLATFDVAVERVRAWAAQAQRYLDSTR